MRNYCGKEISLPHEKGEFIRMLGTHRKWVICCIIILAQVCTICYWVSNKAGYFIDELYSMGYVSNFTGKGDKAQYITTSPEWKVNEWVQNSEYKHYLVLSNEERITSIGFLEGIRLLFLKKNYFGFLNLFESVIGHGYISPWPGVALNIIFFVLAEIAFLVLLVKNRINEKIMYFSLASFGFSGYIIGLVGFIRFYTLVVLYLMIILNLVYDFLKENNIWKNAIQLLTIAVIGYLSIKNTELTIVFIGALISLSVLVVLIKKQYKKCFLILLSVVGFIIYIALQTDFLDALLHIDNYKGSKLVSSTVKYLQNATIGRVKNYFLWIRNLLNIYFFENITVPRIIAITLIAFLLWRLISNVTKHIRKRGNESIESGKIFLGIILVITLSCFIFLVNVNSAESIWRFTLVEITGIIFYIVASKRIKRNCKRDLEKGEGSAFVILVALTTLIYTVFIAMAHFYTERYFFLAFVSFVFLFWYAIDRIVVTYLSKQQIQTVFIVLIICAVVSIYTLFQERNIEYIYEDETEIANEITKHRDLPVVLYGSMDPEGKGVSRHVLYDCVSQMSEESMIYAIDIESYIRSNIDLPNCFLLWSHKDCSADWLINEINEEDYFIQEIGENHVSRVYFCEKND